MLDRRGRGLYAARPLGGLQSDPRGSGNGFEDINYHHVGQSAEARKVALRARYAPVRSDVRRLAGAAREPASRSLGAAALMRKRALLRGECPEGFGFDRDQLKFRLEDPYEYALRVWL